MKRCIKILKYRDEEEFLMKELIFLVDFDRTITLNDSTDELLNQFNPDLVKEYQKKFRKGELRVREYIKGLLESLKVTESEYKDAVSKNLLIDPEFKKFIELGYEIRIVSAGTYENILPNFKKEGINIPIEHIYSNKLSFRDDNIELSFPYDNEDSDEGICKKTILKKYKSLYKKVYFIGDGYSDIGAASEADFVFAKRGRYLEKYCIEKKINFFVYDNFLDIIGYVNENLGGKKCL